ncbi:MAG TPA: cob(I)yrinic acid a,c-diamide adenosyltransferase [Bacteroidales bacterium]|mgnify:FL=1|nr:cob(I)yrinic acid a,c-diamide adenosyltransferase [Bacteroidales bacterium]
MKIYTRTGDKGATSLAGGRRVPKSCQRIEAYGTVDELISWIGLLRGCEFNKPRNKILLYIQDQLMSCAAALATDPLKYKSPILMPDAKAVTKLEKEIDKMEKKLPVLKNFILPGGNLEVSYCHIARCVCRRTERTVLRLGETEEIPLIIPMLLNRLADYLFVLSRQMSLELDNEEIKWP